ncbi:hypothetical protein LZ009_12700 [Ramlibacter sp. XY19]|uniref:hypothetical protein n=1 Tax=Ramlibacter paludis TaxID=2908000 RepID=UPI0023DC76CD|nr:hypothetical protein [Ramlibacter paludis]MCG2593638.1 hypothetical protein [Ramlibacter paludis]
MPKRNQRGGPKPSPKQEAKPVSPPLDRHSGEGAASALETLQTLENRRRLPLRPVDPHAEDPKA